VSLLHDIRSCDAEIESHCAGKRWTLDPKRERASSLESVIENTRRHFAEHWPQQEAIVSAGILAFARAQVAAFPQNLFWDFDYLTGALVECLRTSGTDSSSLSLTEALQCRLSVMTSLHRKFGQASPIRFRYVHDFSYGFDWNKWVLRDLYARKTSGPFSDAFLQHLQVRASELARLIAQRHPTYSALDSQAYRAPFTFSREPQDEERLLRALASRNLIPVRAWLPELPQFDGHNYGQSRRDTAQELKIPMR
jgi:hypothetical protein